MQHRRPALAVLLCSLLAADAAAQIRASELASISQTIDGTVITLEYSRPRVRGRAAVFGDEVKWQEVWTPGANYATTLEISRDVEINQRKVAKGKYSVWMVVRQDKPWTFVLDPRARLFHVAHPDSADNQIRFDVQTVAAPRNEVLTWTFPGVSTSGATLVMHWDTVQVPLQVSVTPSLSRVIAAEKAKEYLGQYTFKWAGGSDSTAYTVTLTHEKGEIVGTWNPLPWEEAEPFVLLHKNGDLFFPGTIRDGEIYDVETNLSIQFQRKSGKVSGFEARSSTDRLQGSATRK
jgi:hypothetical protein